MLFSKRMQISRGFEDWTKQNGASKTIENMIVYLNNIGMIKKKAL